MRVCVWILGYSLLANALLLERTRRLKNDINQLGERSTQSGGGSERFIRLSSSSRWWWWCVVKNPPLVWNVLFFLSILFLINGLDFSIFVKHSASSILIDENNNSFTRAARPQLWAVINVFHTRVTLLVWQTFWIRISSYSRALFVLHRQQSVQ